MRIRNYRRLIRDLIEDGFDTTLQLQLAINWLGVKYDSLPARDRGTALSQSLRFLKHRRKIRYNTEKGRWELRKHRSYHPPYTTEQLLAEHSGTIPKNIDRGILIL